MARRLSEERTRKQLIDPQLEKAGWYIHDHSKVKIEIPVDGYDAELWNGVTDYCLYRENGEEAHNTQHNYDSTNVCFLRAVQSVFLQNRHLETADLYEPPLDMFGADAVERWFTEKEVKEVLALTKRLTIR